MKALAIAVVPTLTLAVIMALTGCSSSPKVTAQKPQYCHTSQNIVVKNGEKVDSATLVECTDDQIKRMPAVKLGMAPNCGQFTYHMQIGSNYVQRKGISCQRLDGTWEVISTTQ
jgi:uncharacterized protein YceK